MTTVQADSCLSSEQIDTLFISVGVRKGGGVGGIILGLMHMTVRKFDFGREITIHTVIYRVYMRFWPTIYIYYIIYIYIYRERERERERERVREGGRERERGRERGRERV